MGQIGFGPLIEIIRRFSYNCKLQSRDQTQLTILLTGHVICGLVGIIVEFIFNVTVFSILILNYIHFFYMNMFY